MGTIIVATDGSQAAASAATAGFELAAQTGDEIMIVVIRDPIYRAGGYPFAYYDAHFLDEYLERAERILEAAIDQAAMHGIAAAGMVRNGDPAAEICALAGELNARMIVVGTHGWGPLRTLLLGSVASGVLQSAPCPVLCGAPDSNQPAIATDPRLEAAVARPG